MKVYFNDKRVPVKGFSSYVDMYLPSTSNDNNETIKLIDKVRLRRFGVGVRGCGVVVRCFGAGVLGFGTGGSIARRNYSDRGSTNL